MNKQNKNIEKEFIQSVKKRKWKRNNNKLISDFGRKKREKLLQFDYNLRNLHIFSGNDNRKIIKFLYGVCEIFLPQNRLVKKLANASQWDSRTEIIYS